MRVAIYSRGGQTLQEQDLTSLLDLLKDAGIEAVVYKSLLDQYAGLSGLSSVFAGASDLDEMTDALISLGGDGTLLDTVCLVRDKQIPVLGINYGRLGFLASLGKENIVDAVKALQDRTYVLDRRGLLHLDASIPLFGEEPFALNEVVIHKREFSSMIKIHTYLNGEFLNTFWSDGLIVSTPTGSTGYSLSCGGPVVFPESDSFVITPIAPHNLNIRPIVVPNNNVISFEVEGRSDDFICTLDSRKEVVVKDVQLAVKKEAFSFNLVRLNENNFLRTLREKLTWGFDTRNRRP
ncbi:MAG: NAD kinase [Chitinophagaceae bacterium]